MGQKQDLTQKKRCFHGFKFISAYLSYKKRKRNTKPFVILKFQFFPIVKEVQFEGKFVKILMYKKFTKKSWIKNLRHRNERYH